MNYIDIATNNYNEAVRVWKQQYPTMEPVHITHQYETDIHNYILDHPEEAWRIPRGVVIPTLDKTIVNDVIKSMEKQISHGKDMKDRIDHAEKNITSLHTTLTAWDKSFKGTESTIDKLYKKSKELEDKDKSIQDRISALIKEVEVIMIKKVGESREEIQQLLSATETRVDEKLYNPMMNIEGFKKQLVELSMKLNEVAEDRSVSIIHKKIDEVKDEITIIEDRMFIMNDEMHRQYTESNKTKDIVASHLGQEALEMNNIKERQEKLDDNLHNLKHLHDQQIHEVIEIQETDHKSLKLVVEYIESSKERFKKQEESIEELTSITSDFSKTLISHTKSLDFDLHRINELEVNDLGLLKERLGKQEGYVEQLTDHVANLAKVGLEHKERIIELERTHREGENDTGLKDLAEDFVRSGLKQHLQITGLQEEVEKYRDDFKTLVKGLTDGLQKTMDVVNTVTTKIQEQGEWIKRHEEWTRDVTEEEKKNHMLMIGAMATRLNQYEKRLERTGDTAIGAASLLEHQHNQLGDLAIAVGQQQEQTQRTIDIHESKHSDTFEVFKVVNDSIRTIQTEVAEIRSTIYPEPPKKKRRSAAERLGMYKKKKRS